MDDITKFYQNKETANHNFNLNKKWYHNILAYDDRYFLVSNFLNNFLKGKKLDILDVACGTGIYERMLNSDIRKNQYIIGVDISGPHININKTSGAFNDIIEMDINKGLDFEKEKFDVIILSEIIEHLFKPEDIIQDCYRCLRKGGILVMTTPNLGSLQNRVSFLFTGNSGEIDYYYNFQHIRFFSRKAVKNIFEGIFGKNSLIFQRACSSLYFYPNNFPIYIPVPRFLQILSSYLLPNLGNGFLKVYKK